MPDFAKPDDTLWDSMALHLSGGSGCAVLPAVLFTPAANHRLFFERPEMVDDNSRGHSGSRADRRSPSNQKEGYA